MADRDDNVTDGKPLSAADPRPGNKPFYINKNCLECGTELVLSYLLQNPNMPEDKIWHDEFVCPVCKDGVYMDWPKEEYEYLASEVQKGIKGDRLTLDDLLAELREGQHEYDIKDDLDKLQRKKLKLLIEKVRKQNGVIEEDITKEIQTYRSEKGEIIPLRNTFMEIVSSYAKGHLSFWADRLDRDGFKEHYYELLINDVKQYTKIKPQRERLILELEQLANIKRQELRVNDSPRNWHVTCPLCETKWITNNEFTKEQLVNDKIQFSEDESEILLLCNDCIEYYYRENDYSD